MKIRNKTLDAVFIIMICFTSFQYQYQNAYCNVFSKLDQTAKDSVHLSDNIRNKRYCEIFVVTGGLLGLTATVYNTLSCNDCPEDVWKSIDIEKLKDELSARAIIMNGPRYFMMDRIGQTGKEPERVMLGGLEMKERATIPVSKEAAEKGGSKPYEENTILRSTEFVYNKGNKVYELMSPSATYVMQSYSLIVDSNLSVSDLDNLESRLTLPKGWKYQVRILDDDLILKTIEEGKAYVLQDDLKNTYQRKD